MQGINQANKCVFRAHLLIVFCLSVMLSACGGGGGNSAPQPLAVGSESGDEVSGINVQDISSCPSLNSNQVNTVRVCVDNGPTDPFTGAAVGAGNRPFITVRLCVPGSTTQCVNVDHMLVDTGSTGIRVATPALSREMKLPAVKTMAGQAVAECMHFISGWAWGSLNQADVYVGGLVARNVPIQMMGNDSKNPTLGGNGGGAFPTVPSACSTKYPNANFDVGNIDAIRANGIIGLGVWPTDDAFDGLQYFVCLSSRCANITDLASSNHPRHLGLSFSSFSNGVSMTMPAIGANGASILAGTLTFGITSLPTGIPRLKLDPSGLFTTTLNGVQYSKSFIDSGSIGFFFDTNAVSIPKCARNAGFYCPTTSMQLSAITSDGTVGSGNIVTFNVGNAEQLIGGVNVPNVLNNLGGPATANGDITPSSGFFWGFPFFLGRTVYTVLLGTTMGGDYGLIAYTP